MIYQNTPYYTTIYNNILFLQAYASGSMLGLDGLTHDARDAHEELSGSGLEPTQLSHWPNPAM